MLKAALAGATLTKLIAGAAAAAAVGGVTMLASTSHPTPPTDHGSVAAAVSHAPNTHAASRATSMPSPTTGDSSGRVSAAREISADEVTTTTSSDPSATHEPAESQLAGLCHAWQAHAAHDVDHGKWMDATAFSRLAAAAEGDAASTTTTSTSPTTDTTTVTTTVTTTETTTVTTTAGDAADGDRAAQDAVDAYCVDLIGSPTTEASAARSGAPATRPTRPALPAQATQRPAHPTHPALPTQATSHAVPPQASGRPTHPAMPTRAAQHPTHPTHPALPTQATDRPTAPTMPSPAPAGS